MHAPPPKSPAAAWNEAGATCIACGIGVDGPGFSSASEQRQHFKTDWHRYNVKRRLDRRPPVTEDQFDRIVELDEEVSSISGSDTADSSSGDDSDYEGEDERRGGAAVADGARQQQQRQRAGRARRDGGAGKAPQLAFLAPDGTPLAVWRCLLYPDHSKQRPDDASLLPELRRVRRSAATWAVLLLRGGHFAGAVFAVRPAGSPGKGVKHAGGDPFEVLAHKTFHRYVVRAKAGGKQSSKDASGKYARSAGSALRRYNEGALAKDIATLMAEWRDLLDKADIIFVHAPSSNAKLVFSSAPERAAAAAAGGGEAWALDPSDSRVRRVPFVTRRPTFSELRRVLLLLGGVMHPRGAAAAEEESLEEGQQQQQQQQQQQRQQDEGGSSSDDAAATGSGAPAAAPTAAAAGGSLKKKAEDPPLIKAAKAGDAARVARLMASGGHDPAATDAQGRTAYQLAPNKEIRDALRRAMAAAPEAWDWAAARIPSPLTDDLEAAQASKKAEKRARQKAKERGQKEGSGEGQAERAAAAKEAMEDEIARAAAEAAAISARRAAAGRSGSQGGAQVRGGGGGGGGGPGRGGGGRQGPLSAEEQARRREQQAAAAEARMKALQQAQQQQQLW